LSNFGDMAPKHTNPFLIITFFLKIATGLVFLTLSLYTTTGYITTGKIPEF
jgi:hypothetical protein